MAIVKNIAMDNMRKSAGAWTFRKVRGRTIASQKRGGQDPSTRALGETIYQFIFALSSRFTAAHRDDINVSFDKTKYGSQGNYFNKINKPGLQGAFTPLYTTGVSSVSITDAQIESAVSDYAASNPEKIFRVKKGGCETVYLSGEWSSEDNPSPIAPTKGSVTAITYDNANKPFSAVKIEELDGNRFEVATGKVLAISGTGLKETVTIDIHLTSEGNSNFVGLEEVITVTSRTDSSIQGTILAAQNGKSIYGIKINGKQVAYLNASPVD